MELAQRSETLVYLKILELRDQLRRQHHRLVLAESCTAGLVAAELGQIPGISEYLCGSLVVYRNDSKTSWLGIDPKWLSDPGIGPVSEPVTLELARTALRFTPEATFAGAVTGHLGPGAPEGLDGVVYLGVAFANQPTRNKVQRTVLESPVPQNSSDLQRRRDRQSEAVRRLVDFLIANLE